MNPYPLLVPSSFFLSFISLTSPQEEKKFRKLFSSVSKAKLPTKIVNV